MRHFRSILVILVAFCLGSIDGDSHQTESNQRGSPTALAFGHKSAIGIAEFMSLSLAKTILVIIH